MRALVVCALLAGCAASPAETTAEQALLAAPAGLSLFVRDGASPPLDLVGDVPHYLQEIDIVDSVVTPTDEGATPALGLFPGVDWHGLHFVEEDWRAPGDGTWTRQRFYRGAHWMEHRSSFELQPLDAQGRPVGDAIAFDAGRDDRWNPARDDGFVRRFVVRQIVKGCRAEGDCSNATAYEVQALAQARQAQHLDAARAISPAAATARLRWTAGAPDRLIAISHSPAGEIGYGFEPRLELVTPPANGQFYAPGDTLDVRVGFFDGAGHSLTTPGALPTYAQTLGGQANGIRYWDPTLDATLFYALKHREGNMILQLSGPANAVHTPVETTGLGEFFGPQVTIASVANDGFSAAGVEIPFLPSVLGGFQDPAQWNLPVSDVQHIQIASDAKPGTYALTIKARREWGGEALDRGATIEVQVGQVATTPFVSSVGHCASCHDDRAALAVVNHGIADRRSCAGCHAPLAFEPDNALDIRIHAIHSRSERFPGTFASCSTCHLTPPSGPARGAFIGDPD